MLRRSLLACSHKNQAASKAATLFRQVSALAKALASKLKASFANSNTFHQKLLVHSAGSFCYYRVNGKSDKKTVKKATSITSIYLYSPHRMGNSLPGNAGTTYHCMVDESNSDSKSRST